MKQPQQPEEDFEGDGEVKPAGGKLKRYLIIGGVVALLIIAIAVPASLKNSGSSEASPVTIESVNTKVNALEAWKSATDESLSGLWEKANSIQNTVNSLKSPKDWTSEINIIKGNITALRDIVDDIDAEDWTPAITLINGKINLILDRLDDLEGGVDWSLNTTVAVTRLEGEYIDVKVNLNGEYPVVVVLYGEGLDPAELDWRYNIYDIEKTWVFNYTGDTILTVVIEHDDGWEAGDLIELKITNEGIVNYAVAYIGLGQKEGGASW